LSQVSKDWRITFFSRAARIWSQGLRAELGEVANDIVQILACIAYGRIALVFLLNSGNGSRTAENDELRLDADNHLPVCCWSARENLHSGGE
jgi:hypothetical protein